MALGKTRGYSNKVDWKGGILSQALSLKSSILDIGYGEGATTRRLWWVETAISTY